MSSSLNLGGLRGNLGRLGASSRSIKGGVPFSKEGARISAPDVVAFLAKKNFFARLDDCLCPADASQKRQRCRGAHELSIRILVDMGIDPEQIPDLIEVLAAMGGSCDCGVLCNVAGENRMRTEYSMIRALIGGPYDPHS